MSSLLQDLRYSLRLLLKRPGFTFIIIITLALGVGANTAIFTVVDATLLRSLPYKNPERLVHLWETKQQQDFGQREASYPDYLDWKQNEVFESVGGYSPRNFTLSDTDAPERIMGASVTSNFFDVLGVKAQLGRTFLPDEDRPGAAHIAILSYGLWQRRYGSDQNITGKQITVNGDSYTVVGVLPANFQFAKVGQADLWLPLNPNPDQLSRRYMHWLNVIGRLKPGVTVSAAESQMQSIANRIAQDDPQAHSGTGILIVPLQDEIVGSLKPMLFLLLGAVGLVLLIACVNVANLLLAKSTARRKEIAIRIALGASRWRVVRQLLTESIMLAIVGGGLGLLLALWGVDLLVAAIPPTQLAFMPYLHGLTLNTEVLIFTCALSLLTGILFGLMPALEASRSALQEAMKDGSRQTSVKATSRLRGALVVSEIALALVLLVGAGLLMKSLLRMLSVDPGFRTENLLTMRLTLPAANYSDDSKLTAFHQELLPKIETLPGVSGVATVSNLPLSDNSGGTGTPRIVGRPFTPNNDWGESRLRTVSVDYFNVMGIPLVQGRFFTERDKPETPQVVIVNQTFVNRLFPNEAAIGQHLTFIFTANQPPFEIVGVVGDEKVTSLDERNTPVIYFPYLQSPESNMSLVVRTTANPESLATAVRGEVQAMDKEIPIYSVMTMERLISNTPATFMRRYPAYLIGIFACVALLLAVVGIYGVISYSVSQRTHEMAIRMALGAGRGDVLKMILKQGMLLAVAGVFLGLAGALALTRLLSSLLFNVSASDPAIYVSVAALLIFIALLACYLPARRATKVDPMVALRYE
ncbi:MAG TPA: ABC transporter permease [Pyrinomonadaceae bacterium]|nr:ABC transporter permease [Pyrinomonadaceae bacterium]